MTKRFRLDGEQVELDSINTANTLMLLSRGGHSAHRVFECKTCNRQFQSFQALGGHRASHKKPKLSNDDGNASSTTESGKQKTHECPICGLEFAIGQALGGHMRRHRPVTGFGLGLGLGLGVVEKKSHGRRIMSVDLNLPPADGDVEWLRMETGSESGDKVSMVDCVH